MDQSLLFCYIFPSNAVIYNWDKTNMKIALCLPQLISKKIFHVEVLFYFMILW